VAMTLRLSGGSFAGRKIQVPKNRTRPATNRVREATFSVLHSFFENGVQDLCVLDLFAGSGSLGIEAMSRGARSCTFVERDHAACECIRENLKALGISGKVVQSDVHRFLHRARGLECNIVFMDPPYSYGRMEKTVGLIRKAVAPTQGPVLSYERIFTPSLPEFGPGTVLLARKRYGQTEVLYYRVKVGKGETE
jgi:16S rRNA (guanine966-N2)-methyltransferase